MVVAADDLLIAVSQVEIQAAGKQPRVSIVAYSGGVMTVPGWGPVAIELAGLDASGQIALLADHDATVGGVVGHGTAEVCDGRVIVTGVVSGTGNAARQIMELTAGGFEFQASVGVQPIEYTRVRPGEKVEVNGRVLSSRNGFTLIRKGRLKEVSITALGADSNTSVAIAAMRRKSTMNTDVQQQVDEQAIRADERERLQAIEATCSPPTGGWREAQARVDELKAAAIAGELAIDDLSTEVLKILRESRPKIQSTHYHSEPTVTATATLEAALFKRLGKAGLGEKMLGALAMEHGDRLKANHAMDLCRTALLLDHQDVPHGREEMVRAALSTYSLPTALGNVANKLLTEAYQDAPTTWRDFCAVRSVNDFKVHSAIRPSWTGSLQQLPPGGEIKHSSVAEAVVRYQVDTFAKMLSIDRRDIINDDLGMLDETARAFGGAAMRKLSDLVYEVLLGNADNFFGAANGNLLEGVDTVLSIESLGRAIAAMLTQRDAEGNDLDLRPATLLVPPELQALAKAVLESEFVAAAANLPTGNSMRQVVGLQVEPRLSNTIKYGAAASKKAWYLFASPIAAPMVVGFLQGKLTPTVEFFGLDQDVNRLAVSWRVYHDFGAALCDPRAGVRATGVAEQ